MQCSKGADNAEHHAERIERLCNDDAALDSEQRNAITRLRKQPHGQVKTYLLRLSRWTRRARQTRPLYRLHPVRGRSRRSLELAESQSGHTVRRVTGARSGWEDCIAVQCDQSLCG